MLTVKLVPSLLAICMIMASGNCLAKWVASDERAFNGNWDVTNTKSGQKIQFKTEKEAKKAARILNKADKSVVPLPDGSGDLVGGGTLK